MPGNPHLAEAQAKDQVLPDPNVSAPSGWLMWGFWVANAILVTLFHLGLTERGNLPSGQDRRYCFRLTPLGRAFSELLSSAWRRGGDTCKFLDGKPNHDVVAYLEGADPKKIWALAQLTRTASPTSGPVQTLTLTRLSVYAALKSGMTAGEIREFLAEYSKSGLPDNVAQSLAEWTRKHEALVHPNRSHAPGIAATIPTRKRLARAGAESRQPLPFVTPTVYPEFASNAAFGTTRVSLCRHGKSARWVLYVLPKQPKP